MTSSVCPLCGSAHPDGATCAGHKRAKGSSAASPEGAKVPGPLVLNEPGARFAPAADATLDADSLVLEMVSMRRETGTMLGPYRLLDLLGEGGMGVVYRAHDTVLERPVAVKLIARSLLQGNRDAVVRFLSEAKLTARIRHKNVVQVHTLGTDETGNPYLVMELLEGKTLKDALKRKEAFPLPRIVHIVGQILSALEVAHAHLVHRDLKPANIFLTTDGDAGAPDFVKILDFGVAKAASEAAADLTGKGRFVGTPAFVAPEVVRGASGANDPRQDLYAVGVLLYFMLSGKSPWASNESQVIFGSLHAGKGPRRIREVLPTIDAALADLVDKAMALSPDERFQSAEEFLAALRALSDYAPGSVVGDTYRVVRKIGEGGMSAAFLCDDLRMERPCVLKVLLLSDEEDPTGTVRERFRRDGALAKELRDPHVVEVYGQGVWRGRPYLVTEFVDGGTLRASLARLDWKGLVSIVGEIARALDAVHGRGIVHRDVTPENILLSREGHAKLGDFSVARQKESDLTGTNLGFVLGRYGYAAPEHILDAREVNAASDEWSLAAVVYEALAGLPPHRHEVDDPGAGEAEAEAAEETDQLGMLERYSQRVLGLPRPLDVRSLNPSVTRAVSEVLARALARNPEDRYPTATSFAEALASADAGGTRLHDEEAALSASDAVAAPTPAPGSTDLAWSPEARRPRSGRRALWLAGGALAVASGLGLFVLLRPLPTAREASARGNDSPLAARPLESAASESRPSVPGPSPKEWVENVATMNRVVIDSTPTGGTLTIGEERFALPTTLERPSGARVEVLIERDGYKAERVALVFDGKEERRTVALGVVPTAGKPAAQSPPRRPKAKHKADEIDWQKDIYVRPEK